MSKVYDKNNEIWIINQNLSSVFKTIFNVLNYFYPDPTMNGSKVFGAMGETIKLCLFKYSNNSCILFSKDSFIIKILQK